MHRIELSRLASPTITEKIRLCPEPDDDQEGIDNDQDAPDDIPPRSSSRLGFHRDDPDEDEDDFDADREGQDVSPMQSHSATKRPPLFRRIAVDGLDECGFDEVDAEESEPVSGSSSDTDEDNVPSSSSSSDEEDESDEDDFIFEAFCAANPHIANPLRTGPPPEESPASDEEESRVPSAEDDADVELIATTTPMPVRTRRPTPQRHNYVHHGHSQSALSHLRYFWRARYDEWVEWEAQMEEANAASCSSAYDGIDPSLCAGSHLHGAPPRGGPPRDKSSTEQLEPAWSRYAGSDPDAPIYPRTGDLASLRDVCSVHMDRWYHTFPLHKIHRRLYLHDMEQRLASEASRKAGASTSHSPSPTSEDGDSEDERLDRGSPIQERGGLLGNEEPYRPWEVDWSFRWSAFTQVLQEDRLSLVAKFAGSSSDAREVHWQLAAHTSKFFIADFEDEEDWEDGEDEEEDEEEDYGTLISNPTFGGPALLELHGRFRYTNA